MSTVAVVNEAIQYVNCVKKKGLVDEHNGNLVELVTQLTETSEETKSRRFTRHAKISGGLECPICNQVMQRRKHGKNWIPKKTQVNFFQEWDYCKSCQRIQHYEEFRVIV